MSTMSRSVAGEEESIYKLIPPPPEVKKKEPLYRSKYPGDLPPTGSTFLSGQTLAANVGGNYTATVKKKLGSTLGPREGVTSDPKRFLKKRAGEPELPEAHKFSYDDATRKPAIVKREDAPVLKRNEKDFIQQNAVEAIMKGSTRRNSAVSHSSKKSLADPLKKEGFGTVPSYLEQVKEAIQKEKDYIQQLADADKAEEDKNKVQLRVMPEDERQELLAGLKKKWTEVNKEYQMMAHIVVLDTLTKIRRKEDFEQQLAHLEKSMEKLSKKVVYVRDD